jgi:2-haloacid dehalogenase
MQLDGLFIDMYGTLTTGDRAAVETVCTALVRDTGLRLTPQELAITWGNVFFAAMNRANSDGFHTLYAVESASLVETMLTLGVQIDPAPYLAQLVTYWRKPPLQSEVPAFLAATRVPICVVSNADRADLLAALAGFPAAAAGGAGRLPPPITHVVTSEDAGSYKPDTRIFEHALAQTGWRRTHVLHVGDSLHSDIGGARDAGLRSVWVNRAHRIHDIGTAEPDFEVADLLEVGALLARD